VWQSGEIEHSGVKEQVDDSIVITTAMASQPMDHRRGKPGVSVSSGAPSRIFRVRRRPGERSKGILIVAGRAIPVALGRSGILANKWEGDGGTPRGRFHPLRLWWRADKSLAPRTLLPLHRIGPADAWSEDPADRNYNRPVKRPPGTPGDRLRRADHLYDIIVEIDHNTRPRTARRGSAVFIHLARPGFLPTAGCVALEAKRLRWLVSRLGPKTVIDIR
jgi:L,D-peptidoglycan transpeptidase YkuD (ErfK/YbiS/YcfS/YnhG family)